MENKENEKKGSPKRRESNKKQAHEASLKDSSKSGEDPGQEAYVPTWNPQLVGFPWDFPEKWPVTRAERLRELEILTIHYGKTGQKDNIAAAKEWHARFPPDQVVPDDEVIFQDGKIVKESEINDDGGNTWEEGAPPQDYMTGNPSGFSQNPSPPLGPPSNATEESHASYYTRATDSHMYQV